MSTLEYKYQNKTILFKFFKSEVYMNTKIAKEFNKKFENYLNTKIAKRYIQTLESVTYLKDKLIIQNDNGSWIHNSLAIDFAKWLNFEFSIWYNLKLKEILSKNESYIKVLEKENEALQSYISYQDIKVLFLFEMKDNILMELKKIDKLEKRSSFI